MPARTAPAATRTEVALHRAAAVPYADGLRWQLDTASALRAGEGGEAVAVLEHEPVYTLGARGGTVHLLLDAARMPAAVVPTDRGGDVTFHGPGQLVAYPVLNLRARGVRAADYVRALEATVIETLAAFGIEGTRFAGRPGVWVASVAGVAKIAAVGVRIDRGISRHGLALNISTNLAWFDAIVPCGIADARVTSMAEVLSGAPAFEAVADAFGGAFEAQFGVRLVSARDKALGDSGRRPSEGGSPFDRLRVSGAGTEASGASRAEVGSETGPKGVPVLPPVSAAAPRTSTAPSPLILSLSKEARGAEVTRTVLQAANTVEATPDA